MADALEIVGRVTLIYVAITVLLRVAGKKELASLSPIDLVTMLLLSETVSQALVGGSASLWKGLLAATTLIGLTVLVSAATFRSRRLRRAIEGSAQVLIRDGRLDAQVLRRERLTDAELGTALHAAGVRAVDEVARAFVEPSGAITIVKRVR
jgi:uncharacterized membrane protein YcaP (DUF421 family)